MNMKCRGLLTIDNGRLLKLRQSQPLFFAFVDINGVKTAAEARCSCFRDVGQAGWRWLH